MTATRSPRHHGRAPLRARGPLAGLYSPSLPDVLGDDGAGTSGRWPAPSAAYALLVAVSLLALAAVDDMARSGAGDAATLFWLPLVVMFAAAAIRLFAREQRLDANERLRILVTLGLGLYVAKVLHSPSEFTFSDELSTLRTTKDLAASGHLLSTNALAKAFALYPGVDLIALTLAQISGLPLFASGLILIGVAKVVVVVALFRIMLAATGATRTASIAVLVYMTNPNFLFFDSQFGYESFALAPALGALALVSLAVPSRRPASRRALTALAALSAVATAPSHHITSYALAIILALWALALRLRNARRADPVSVMPVLAVLAATVTAIAVWLAIVGQSTSEYLQPVLGGAANATFDFLTGAGRGKAPFNAPGSPANAPAEQLLAFGSVLLLLALLAAGLLRLRRERPPTALAGVLTLLAAIYPLSLLLRLTQAGAETSNRASEFVFLGLALVAGGVLSRISPGAGAPADAIASATAPRRRPWPRALATALFAAIMLVLFSGGIVVGWPPSSRIPGRPLLEADPRSVEVYDLAAARWAAAHLPPHSRLVADRENGLLMSAYGNQDPQIGAVQRLPLGAVITSPSFDRTDRAIVAAARLQYIVVDRRLAGHLPAFGVYVDHDEPEAYEHRTPLPASAVTKFAGAAGLRLIYDNGEVSIYAVQTPPAGSATR